MKESFELRVSEDFAAEFAAVLTEQLPKPPGEPGSLFLTGGSQARAIYPRLGEILYGASAGRTRLYLGDERIVDVGDPDSNTALVRGLAEATPRRPASLEFATPALHFTPTLTQGLAGPHPAGWTMTKEQKGLLSGILDNYEATVQASPRPRIVHLGLGPDGHVASIFPNLTDFGLSRGSCQASWDLTGRNPHPRISLTMGFINSCEAVILGLAGPEKGLLLRRILESPAAYPAGLLNPGKLIILADHEAAAALSGQT